MTTLREAAQQALEAKRASVSTSANVAIWGCIICSNLWFASGVTSGNFKLLIAAAWLAFAGLILWIERRTKENT